MKKTKSWGALVALTTLTGSAFAQTAPKPTPPEAVKPISVGAPFDPADHVLAEKPTIFVFLRPASTLEVRFFEELRALIGSQEVGLRAVHLKTGMEPVAAQHGVVQTPAALVVDRFGRTVIQTADPETIRDAVKKAAKVPRIAWPEDGDPRIDEIKRRTGFPIPSAERIPGILRTMSVQPEVLIAIQQLSEKTHFADGALTRREKEMISTYVSALNKCKY